MTCVSTSSYKKWELSLIRILLRCCGVVHRFVSLSAHCTHQFQCTKAATSCTHHGHCKDGNPYWLLFPRIIILTPWPQFIRCDSPSLSLHLSPLGCLIEGHYTFLLLDVSLKTIVSMSKVSYSWYWESYMQSYLGTCAGVWLIVLLCCMSHVLFSSDPPKFPSLSDTFLNFL